jgi:rSAM/selenodomain-associated transferase 1
MLFDDTVILLFAKAPIEGLVNTRLIPHIGSRAATALQIDLIHQRLTMLTRAELCAVHLLCAPDTDNGFFQQCKRRYPVKLEKQSEGDIGKRMLSALQYSLLQYKYCIVIGTDAPALDTESIKLAIEVLKSGIEVVFVPAEDGGYVLTGLQRVYDFMFQGIDWGSSRVMQQTRDKLEHNNVSYSELAMCWDIDRIADYQRYLQMNKQE